jgi:NAD(P)H dehydrogenase (quinone)
MSKILVLFHSNDGNKSKMASLVAEGAEQIEGAEVRCLAVDDASYEDLK